MSGIGDTAEDEVGGGGGLDFFRSLWAHEKRPPLLCFGGARGDEPRSTNSFEFEREWGVGCTGNDLVECALLGTL